MIKVLIADDHALLAESMQYVLRQDQDLESVGIALDGSEAVEMCGLAKPHLVLMDIRMLKCDGLQAAHKIKALYPEIKVVILTTFEDRESIIEALLKGVDGYILKDVRPADLITAIKCISAGFTVVHNTVKELLREEFKSLTEKNKGGSLSLIKPEDLELIKLISDGKNNREIAELLNYSEGTIKNRVSRIMDLVGAKDRTQVVVYALKNDLI